MYEIGEYINIHSKRKLSTAIMRFPSGKYGFVGSIPVALTHESRIGTPQYPPNRDSNSYDTEEEAIKALLNIGITEFQLSDCKWYVSGK